MPSALCIFVEYCQDDSFPIGMQFALVTPPTNGELKGPRIMTTESPRPLGAMILPQSNRTLNPGKVERPRQDFVGRTSGHCIVR